NCSFRCQSPFLQRLRACQNQGLLAGRPSRGWAILRPLPNAGRPANSFPAGIGWRGTTPSPSHDVCPHRRSDSSFGVVKTTARTDGHPCRLEQAPDVGPPCPLSPSRSDILPLLVSPELGSFHPLEVSLHTLNLIYEPGI